MAIQIFNSLTKTKEEFVPLNGKTVKMYSCGVTVYDKCHIGHARSLYIFDMIKRYLVYRGYDVRFVRNITDVDDKIINKANELNVTSLEVSEKNIKDYQDDLKRLGVDQADVEPKATESIPEIILGIETLIEKGFAYEVQGDVYYSVRAFKEYGKLSGQSVEHMLDNVRIEEDPKKKDPLDFALWKKSKEGEPTWESPWGPGRPGWHIECSCMSMKHLEAETIDIHAGGRDLIFPHHENEIAQSEAMTGKKFAKYWIHCGLLTINNQKMAKSLGNFITIEDALNKYTIDQLKFFFLSSHYSSPIDFTEEKMIEAQKAMQRFDVLFWKAHEILKDKDVDSHDVDFIKEHEGKFIKAMDNDFNSAKALGSLFDLINDTNKFIDQEKDNAHYEGVVFAAVNTIEGLAKTIFGLFSNEKDEALSGELEDLIEQRRQAREQKDFQRSDELRDLLKEKGVVVEDTKDGQTWRWA